MMYPGEAWTQLQSMTIPQITIIASRDGEGPEEEARAHLRANLYGVHQLSRNPNLNEGTYFDPDPQDTGAEEGKLCQHCTEPLENHENAACKL